MVYTTGSCENDTPQAIIVITFDPAITLPGLEKWKGVSVKNKCTFERRVRAKGIGANRRTAGAVCSMVVINSIYS
jgi:hypothetical protein